MGKRKNSLNSNVSKDDSVTWTPQMDDVLIDAFVHQNNIGNRVGGTFTSKAHDNILKEVSEKFPEVSFDKAKIKNRMKYIKRGFGPCYDIFKNGLSGFSWNSATSTWGASADVWKKLLEKHPEATPWMNKPVRNYKKLASLYGNDRATLEDTETAAEVRERIAQLNDEEIEVQEAENIEEVDLLISQNQASLGGHNISPESLLINKTVEGASTSKKKQKINKINDDEAAYIKESFKSVADAIERSTSELVKSNQRLQIPESEIWAYLEELQLDDEEVKNDAYLYLTENPAKLGAFLGCPTQSRKRILLKMLQNSKSA
ncbi:hypothetical protein LUZ61_015124 [Rhynchospora tenuis]|uniref:Myb/SANT-like domain-containing protein n=1 Tax=Rhynchospora tenuis TaxID=198213 RepID=A0AAD5WC24_9POAL|nr:hypothetical protein LUZ61_015124 [Rhynchospora tenuis]